MKYSTIHLDNNKIELFNSLLGKETVKVNGEIVSSKYSMLGADHKFTISEDKRQVDCNIRYGFGVNGVVFDLYKDGDPIIESEKSGCLGLVLVMVIISALIVVITLIT